MEDLTMSVADHQTLRVLDGSYVLDRPADVTEISLRADVLAVVFGPDGSTVVRRDDTAADAWSALWNGDDAHGVEATGMLSAIVAPLAAGGLPVWVVSSYDGDVILVPTDRLGELARCCRRPATRCDGDRDVGRRVTCCRGRARICGRCAASAQPFGADGCRARVGA